MTILRYPDTDDSHVTQDTQDTQDTQTHRKLRIQRNRELKETQDKQDSVEELSVGTIPQAVAASLKDGIHEKVLFNFSRHLRGLEKRFDRRFQESELPAIFNQWWHTAKVDDSYDLWLADFLYTFGKTRIPIGVSVLEQAKAKASEIPAVAKKFDARVGKLVSVCWHMAKINGDGCFFIGVRDVATILVVKNLYTASAVMASLVSMGVIKQVEKGTNKGRKATRYRFA